MTQVLVLKNLCISTGDRQILHKTNLAVEDRKLTFLMGPMGSGKSTLVKFLAGKHDTKTLNVSFDQADYRKEHLGGARKPIVIFQKAREQGSPAAKLQRRLAEIENTIKNSDELLCIDEPTNGLSEQGSAIILNLLKDIVKKRAVIVISHNTKEARHYSDHVVLIAGGRVVASLPTPRFFDKKSSVFATHFLKTGGLDIPFENTPIQFLPPETRTAPKGFDNNLADPALAVENWVIRDLLSVISMPVDQMENLDKNFLSALSPPRIVYHFCASELVIYGVKAVVENRISWAENNTSLECDLPLIGEICHEINELIAAQQLVTINTGFNQPVGAAILGALLILNKFSPADALSLTGNKFPELSLAMDFEQFLWNIDAELSCRSSS